ncbi:T9SS type A sorting domain-containing protein [Rudanella lutea]|uniref:T9SS type A sorting domain-containing protein n=1 Tax=Rudanella lutea TaxID=451374 RepID=UPI00039CAE7D
MFPNPTHDEVTLSFGLEQDEAATLTIADITGRVIHTASIVGLGVVHEERISLRTQPVGLYLVRIKSAKRTLAGKIVLSR